MNYINVTDHSDRHINLLSGLFKSDRKLTQIKKIVAHWYFNYSTRADLKRLTNHQLKDLGLFDYQRIAETNKYFWQD